MKKIIYILALSLLLSSCRIPESIMAEYDSNPFLDRKEIRVDNSTIVFFTDAHIGRERKAMSSDRTKIFYPSLMKEDMT